VGPDVNADEWYAKLNSIPYGLSIENWKTATVTVPSSITGARPQPYAVQYRNVENMVRFLLGAHTASWGPVCLIVYARAAIDFWTIAQYSSHDDNTLEYMEHALYQIDMLKSAFRKHRINNRDKDESGHFNFPKFHAINSLSRVHSHFWNHGWG
jgi:hypothetical protein